MSSISSIEGVLSQMRQLAALAESQNKATTPAAQTAGGFAAEMEKALKSVSSAQMQARSLQQDFILGKNDVQLNDVMIEMQKASIGFQSAIQVRNKLVTAYQTIASMPL